MQDEHFKAVKQNIQRLAKFMCVHFC